MPAPPAMRTAGTASTAAVEAFLLVVAVLRAVRLRLSAGDESGQAADILAFGRLRLRLRLALRHRLLARRKRLRVARQERLRLRFARRKARLVLVRLTVVLAFVVLVGGALRAPCGC